MSNGECRYGQECSTFKTGRSHPEYGVHTSRWSHTTRSGPSSDVNANIREAGSRAAAGSGTEGDFKRVDMDVKRFDITSNKEICPILQSPNCMLIGADATHAEQFCHLPMCPVDPSPSCSLLPIEKGHNTSFAHISKGAANYGSSSSFVSKSSPSTNNGDSAAAATEETANDKRSCPNGSNCKLISDATHAQRWVHPCPSKRCKLTETSHLDRYTHPCPNDQPCEYIADAAHCARFHHPEDAAKLAGKLAQLAAKGAATVVGDTREECKYGDGCRMNTPNHPNYAVHSSRFRHPKLLPPGTVLPLCENDTHEPCGIFRAYRDDPHNEQFKHRCRDGDKCKSLNLASHLQFCTHPCPKGVGCDLWEKGDKAHMRSYWHTPQRPDYCPRFWDCTNSETAHIHAFRHMCPNVLDKKDCKLTSKEKHLLRFLHPCQDGEKCPHIGSDHEISKVHMLLYQHPCKRANDCKFVSSAPHCYEFSHNIGIKTKTDFPKEWDHSRKGEIEFVDVPSNSQEFKDVKARFDATIGKPATLHHVRRYQNRTKWIQYDSMRKQIKEKNGGDANEKMLFHGTKRDVADLVLGRGVAFQDFDERVAKLSGSVGAGIYTAVNANYSDSGYVGPPDANGFIEMLYCTVICGASVRGQPGLKEPPLKPGSATEHYDSVNNDHTVMFVVYNRHQIYPTYILTYKKP